MNILGLAILIISPILVSGFSFTTTAPTQCDDLKVTWSGGQPPFRLLIVPPGGAIRNVSIPSSAFQGGSGTFTTQLNVAENQRLILSMSDATGVTAGGTSDVLTVGAPANGNNCNTTDPAVDFFFSLNTDLSQCKSYPFTDYTNAVQPITILALIPLGQSFMLYPPLGDSFNWIANVTSGTPISFSVTDAQGRIGGTSSVRVAKTSNDSSCLSSTSTTSTSSSTSTSSASQTQVSNSSQTPGTTSGSNTGIIIAASVGGFVVLAGAAFLAYFCFVRRRRSRYAKIDLTYAPTGAPAPEGDSYLLAGHYTPIPFVTRPPPTSVPLRSTSQHYTDSPLPNPHFSEPPALPPPGSSSTYYPQAGYAAQEQQSFYNSQPPSRSLSGAAPLPAVPSLSAAPSLSAVPSLAPTALYNDSKSSKLASMGDSGMGSNIASTSASGSSANPPRVIMHTDIEESMLPLELPPQYSESRTPLPGFSDINSASGSTSGNSKSQVAGKLTLAN